MLSGVLTASSINLVIIVVFSKLMYFLGSKIPVDIFFNKNAQNLNLF